MSENVRRGGRVNYVVAWDGRPLTSEDLPKAGLKRWDIRRKAEVVTAVQGGLLALDEACRRYALTSEEYAHWLNEVVKRGYAGLAMHTGTHKSAS